MTDVSLGRIVHYRSRTGDYTCAALVTATPADISEVAAARADNIPKRRSVRFTQDGRDRVHLCVFGLNGQYQEHDVPHDPAGSPATWRWPHEGATA